MRWADLIIIFLIFFVTLFIIMYHVSKLRYYLDLLLDRPVSFDIRVNREYSPSAETDFADYSSIRCVKLRITANVNSSWLFPVNIHADRGGIVKPNNWVYRVVINKTALQNPSQFSKQSVQPCGPGLFNNSIFDCILSVHTVLI